MIVTNRLLYISRARFKTPLLNSILILNRILNSSELNNFKPNDSVGLKYARKQTAAAVIRVYLDRDRTEKREREREMGGKGIRRREKNYRAAHDGGYTRLPPPPDYSKADALPSKLRKLLAFTASHDPKGFCFLPAFLRKINKYYFLKFSLFDFTFVNFQRFQTI